MERKKRKKDLENRCIKIILDQIPQFKKYSLDKSRTENGFEEERPDFILKKDESIIGIEHFLVDTLFKKQIDEKTKNISLDGSFNRRLSDTTTKFFNKYEKNKLSGNEEKALKEVENIVNDITDAETNFSYDDFEKEFFRIAQQHVEKIKDYRSASNFNFTNFGFVCEIDIINHIFLWNVFKNNKRKKQRINGIPLTKNIWSFIHKLLLTGDIDFFIIITIPTFNVSKAKSLFLTKDSTNLLIFDSFEYPYTGIKRECCLELEKEDN